MPDSNEQAILLAARELLPQFPGLWDQDYIDPDGVPTYASTGERAIVEVLSDLWTDTRTIGALTSIDSTGRTTLLDVIEKVCR